MPTNQTQQHYDAKAAFKQDRRTAPIEEKLLALWFLQQVYVDLVGSRRPLQPWQQPWDIRSDVRETVVFGAGDNLIQRKWASAVPVVSYYWTLTR